ncbi:hypothetical protein JQ582_39135 [Bradyrhizobium japonicum]|uniref:hypothetical protein n=1 Tax=Bradyrhizobium japonicum TaxID=375 RepID=UPI001BA7416B|nr:hypothetical protein [Bradyrhizobium japonicum]MBR0749942.1 hypothetical protein [Bradyrhizobium japonicum]
MTGEEIESIALERPGEHNKLSRNSTCAMIAGPHYDFGFEIARILLTAGTPMGVIG